MGLTIIIFLKIVIVMNFFLFPFFVFTVIIANFISKKKQLLLLLLLLSHSNGLQKVTYQLSTSNYYILKLEVGVAVEGAC